MNGELSNNGLELTKPAPAMELRSSTWRSPDLEGGRGQGLSEIDAAIVEETWQDVADFSAARVRKEMAHAAREQPDLLAFVLGLTESLPRRVNELAGYIYFVIWQAFCRSTKGKLPRVKAPAIDRKFKANEQALERLQGANARFLEKAALAQITKQAAVFAYMVEAIFEADQDEEDPVEMTEEQSGTLFWVLKTVIDVLHETRQSMPRGTG